MKLLLRQLLHSNPLTREQAESIFSDIMDGATDPAQTASLLTLLATREPTVDELTGAATVMRRHAIAIDAPDNVIDVCGTGGACSPFFNISTTAAIVAAACGLPVAKHGNRSVTSRSGSSDVLRALGVNIETTPEQEAACLRDAKICFAFAPRHHPAMKHVAPLRQSLGFPTIFNLLGPLTNPAGARRQLVGTSTPQLADKICQVLKNLGTIRAMVVCGTDAEFGGLCEISVTGPTYIAVSDQSNATLPSPFTPESVLLKTHKSARDLVITSPQESAAKIRSILHGEHGAPRDIVVINAAAAIWVGGAADSLSAAVPQAQAVIDSGAAARTLELLIARSHAYA